MDDSNRDLYSQNHIDKNLLQTDPRVLRTKEKFYQTLSDLLGKKSLEEISVSELSEAARINRSTFYLHYANIAELYDEIKNSLLEEYRKTLTHYYSNFQNEDRSKEEFLLTETFKFISKNQKYLPMFLVRRNDNDILQEFISLGEQTFLNTLSKNQKNIRQDEFDLYYAFIVNGIIAVIRNWVNNGMREDPVKMAKMIMRFVYIK